MDSNKITLGSVGFVLTAFALLAVIAGHLTTAEESGSKRSPRIESTSTLLEI